MVRLEKINLDEKSWWSPQDAPHSPPVFGPQALPRKCLQCGVESKIYFEQGWTCMNVDASTGDQCSEYYKFEQDVDDKALTYSQEFLRERTQFQGTVAPLIPPLFKEDDLHKDLGGYELGKRGIVCPGCGGCTAQARWGHWDCDTKDCGFKYTLIPKPITADVARMDPKTFKTSKMKRKELMHEDISLESWTWGSWKVNQYTMVGEKGEAVGVIFHLKAGGIDSDLNKQPNGANDIFRMLQESAEEMGLKRNPSKGKGSESRLVLLTSARNC